MKKRPLPYRREQGLLISTKEFRLRVFDGKLKDAKDVLELPKMMHNPAAFAKFKKGDNAGSAPGSLRCEPFDCVGAVRDRRSRTINQLRTIALSELEELENGSPVKEQKLRDLSEALKKVASHGGIKLGHQTLGAWLRSFSHAP